MKNLLTFLAGFSMFNLDELFDFPEIHLSFDAVDPRPLSQLGGAEVERLYSQGTKTFNTARIYSSKANGTPNTEEVGISTRFLRDKTPDTLNQCDFNNTCEYRYKKGLEVCSDRDSKHCQPYRMFMQEKEK